MKNALLVLVCLATTTLYAYKPLDGIGKFKIGKTSIAIIDQLKKELHIECRRVLTPQQEFAINADTTTKNILAELVADTNDYFGSPPYSRHCPGARVFLLTQYTIDKVVLKGIHLVFLNDTLVLLDCIGSPEIDALMTTKYGPSNDTTIEKDVHCTLGWRKEHKTFKDWQSKDVSCESYTLEWFSGECDLHYTRLFYIKNPEKLRIIEDADGEAWKKAVQKGN